jgi:lipopolysaccharide export system protein LptA
VLRSDAAELRTDPEGYNYAIATAKPGNLAFIRQKRDNVDEYIQGYGERIEYDGKQEISKLINRARMERLQGATQLDEIRGAVITYDGQKEFYTASGGADNATAANPSGRVRAVLAPRSSAPAASPAPAPAAPSTPAAKP